MNKVVTEFQSWDEVDGVLERLPLRSRRGHMRLLAAAAQRRPEDNYKALLLACIPPNGIEKERLKELLHSNWKRLAPSAAKSFVLVTASRFSNMVKSLMEDKLLSAYSFEKGNKSTYVLTHYSEDELTTLGAFGGKDESNPNWVDATRRSPLLAGWYPVRSIEDGPTDDGTTSRHLYFDGNNWRTGELSHICRFAAKPGDEWFSHGVTPATDISSTASQGPVRKNHTLEDHAKNLLLATVSDVPGIEYNACVARVRHIVNALSKGQKEPTPDIHRILNNLAAVKAIQQLSVSFDGDENPEFMLLFPDTVDFKLVTPLRIKTGS